MADNSDKKDLATLTQNPSLLKDLLAISGRINQLAGQFPQSTADIKYYQKEESLQGLFQESKEGLTRLMGSLVSFVSPEKKLDASSGIIKYTPVIDVTDNLLENVDICLDKVKNHLRDQQQMEQIQKDQENYKKVDRVDKPQSAFLDSLDNSDRPFIPLLKDKAHQETPLEHSILQAQQDPEAYFAHFEKGDLVDFQLPHPYQHEIDNLTYPDCQLQVPTEAVQYRPFLPTDYLMVDDQAKLEAMVAELEQAETIAMDLEHHAHRTFQGVTCLLQISTREQDFLVDTLVPEVRQHLHLLNRVTANPSKVKVLHGADSDVLWLQRDFGVYLVNLFDTYHAAKALQLPNLSLKHLLDKYCRILTNKKLQLADWRVRPLKEEMVEYARQDTHYLLYIYDEIRLSLSAQSDSPHVYRQSLLKVLSESALTCLQTYLKPVLKTKAYYFLLAKQKAILSPAKYLLLKSLLKLRDQIAREEDESVTYVMNNQTLFSLLALSSPVTRQTLVSRMTKLSDALLRHQDALLDLLADPSPPDTPIYAKSQEISHLKVQLPPAQLKWLYPSSEDVMQEEQPTLDLPSVALTLANDYRQNQQFLPRGVAQAHPAIQQIEKAFQFKNETHFLKQMMPEIVELFQTQERQEKSQKLAGKTEKTGQEAKEEASDMEREEFIQLGEDKGDGNRNTFINPSGKAQSISRDVVTKKQSAGQVRDVMDKVRKEKFKEETKISKQEMRDIVSQFNAQKIQANKHKPADPIDQVNKAFGDQGRKKQGSVFKKSIFGGPRSKASKNKKQ